MVGPGPDITLPAARYRASGRWPASRASSPATPARPRPWPAWWPLP